MHLPYRTPSTETNTVDEFEREFWEENMPLLSNLRIKEMMNSAKLNDPAIWPFK
jgi:hypothetical protein